MCGCSSCGHRMCGCSYSGLWSRNLPLGWDPPQGGSRGSFVPDAGHRQRIELRLAPPDPIRSRPLRTGKEFLLILREQRIVARTWNKALYDPDEEAQLAVTGKHLGDAPLRLVVE